MLRADVASTQTDLDQILRLQKENLVSALSNEELGLEGFVTLEHTPEILERINQLSPAVVVRDKDDIVGYALVFVHEARRVFPPLEPMFKNLETLSYRGRPFSEQHFYIMGQICISKDYRGRGLFTMLYQKHRELFQAIYDFVVTEIATRNHRSLRAHQKMGFETIGIYRDELDEWTVVVWDWR